MDAWSFVLGAVVLLGAATALGLLSQRLGLGLIVGALLAGVLVGPSALGVVERGAFLDTAGELGVTLLLFTVGLEFSWRELARVGRRTIALGALQVLVSLAAFAALVAAGPNSWATAIVVGAMVALSSTATVIATLRERSEVDALHARLATAVLLFQDMAVVPLVILTAALTQGATASAALIGVATSLVAALALAGALYLLSRRVFPRVMAATTSSGSRDLPILVSVVTCLGAAWLAHRLGVSPGIGAFVAGLLLASSPFATRVRADIGALRALFVTTFFATVGMRADLAWIGQHAALVVLVVAVLMIGKAALAAGIGIALGFPPRVAVATGLCLAQVGEFAFVLAGVAGAPELLGETLVQLLVAAAVVSLILTPWLVTRALDVGKFVEAVLARLGIRGAPQGATALTPGGKQHSGHVLVLGLGPSGRGAALALQAAGIEVLAIELSPRTAAQAEREGIESLVGDAASDEVLEHAGLRRAKAVIVTVPDLRAGIEVIGVVRAQAPHVAIVARGRYHVHALHLLGGGATLVVDEEWETGGKMGEAAAALLGMSAPPVADPAAGTGDEPASDPADEPPAAPVT